MTHEQLKLENQLCFPFYAISRLIIRKYQNLLNELGITYPQYLVLLVLWETDYQPVNDISKRLFLNTNTITPLIKRLEKLKIVKKEKGQDDERKMYVKLTDKGLQLKEQAAQIPYKLVEGVDASKIDLIELKISLDNMIGILK